MKLCINQSQLALHSKLTTHGTKETHALTESHFGFDRDAGKDTLGSTRLECKRSGGPSGNMPGSRITQI